MSFVVNGMEMPVTCCHCPLMGYDSDIEWTDSMARTGAHICVLTGELIDNTKREEHCPLVPAADVRPVKRGKWTLNKDGSGTCSECGRTQKNCWDLDNWDNFCHFCGADMRKVTE